MPRKLENWIESFLEYTENTEPSVRYRKWSAISTIASVMQRKCKLVWGREIFFPNLYVVLVGPPAARKGTAMREGKKFLDRLGIAFSADEGSRQALIKNMAEAAVADQTSDGKIVYHSSLTIFSSELTVFLGYDSKELLSMLCKWYDCEDRFEYETIRRGRETIPNVWANLFGATTPGQLQDALPAEAVSSGFTSRILFIYAPDKEKIVIKPSLDARQQELEDLLFHDLADIRQLHGEFTTTPSFDELYDDWRHDSESRRVFTDSRLDYYVQRRPTHLFKLSMIVRAAKGGGLELTDVDLSEALTILEECESFMPEVFRGVGANPLAGVQLRIMHMFEVNKSIPRHVLEREFFSDLSSQQLQEVIDSLMRMQFIEGDSKARSYKYIGDKNGM